MISELDRINYIVSEFLVLSKPQAVNFKLTDVRVILEDIAKFFQPQAILGDIQLDIIFEQEVPLVYGEINQLKQVFINVLKNSMDAMPGGGTVTIRLNYRAPDSVVVRVIDQGAGIPEDVLHRIGEPFVTSKEHGTGLGLMVTKQIIANHKGSISFQSKPGEGTCVEISLPVYRSAS